MKNSLLQLLKAIGFVESFIFPYSLKRVLLKLHGYIYSGWVKREFKQMDGVVLGQIKLSGGKCISVGKDTMIFQRVQLEAIDKGINGEKYNPEIRIGEDVYVQRDVQISSSNKVVIGNHVDIAARTLITDTVHGDFSPASFTFDNGSDIPDVFLKNARTRDYVSKGPIVIEDNVHIGMNCVIMPGVTIGHNSVVSAGTVVSKNVPPYSLVSGNPCKVISFSE